MAQNMACRYDPEHGTFATAFLLGRHYREVHGDVYVKPTPPTKRFRCRICGDGRSFLNAGSHLQQVHPVEYAQGKPYASRWFEQVDTANPSRAVDVLDELNALQDRREVNGTTPKATPRHVGPWDVDDIVLPVVEQLASPKGLVPVAHLAAVFAWRDATAVMLATVTGR